MHAAENALPIPQHVKITAFLKDTNIQQPVVHPRFGKQSERPAVKPSVTDEHSDTADRRCPRR